MSLIRQVHRYSLHDGMSAILLETMKYFIMYFLIYINEAGIYIFIYRLRLGYNFCENILNSTVNLKKHSKIF